MYERSTYPGFTAAAAALATAISLLLALPAQARLPVEAANPGDRINDVGHTLSRAASQAGAGGHPGGGGDVTQGTPAKPAHPAAGPGAADEPAAGPSAPVGGSKPGGEPDRPTDRVAAVGERAESDVEAALKDAMSVLERVQAAADGILGQVRAAVTPQLAERDTLAAPAADRGHASPAAEAVAGAETIHRMQAGVIASRLASAASASGTAQLPAAATDGRRQSAGPSPAAADSAGPLDAPAPGGTAAAWTAAAATIAVLLAAWLLPLAGLRSSLRFAAALSPPLGVASLLERPG